MNQTVTPAISDDLVEKALRVALPGASAMGGTTREWYAKLVRTALEAVADDLRAEVLREVEAAIQAKLGATSRALTVVRKMHSPDLAAALRRSVEAARDARSSSERAQ